MKLSYNWLQDYFEKGLPSPEEMKEKLSLHAFEVEGVEKKGDDFLLDIDILPNRAHDALGYIGIAREIAILFDLELKLPDSKYKEDSKKGSDYIKLEINNSMTRRAMKRVVLDVVVDESPDWLKTRLRSMEQKPINNIVDITNFVMWETGQPVHAFDLDKIIDGKIDIREAEEGEKITTLDKKEYSLRKGMLVISDPKKALDIAGIKGGEASGIDKETKRVVLSVCSFDPTWIRKTSIALDLKTDASYRFERDISPSKTLEAIERLSELVSSVAGGRVLSETLDVYPNPVEKTSINLTLKKTNKVLGTDIDESELETILSNLEKYSGFSWEGERGDYKVTPPLERVDLLPSKEKLASGNEEDLIEEIGRIYGFYKIESKLPENFDFKPKVNKEVAFVEQLKDFLVSRGFSEVITYSFVKKGVVKLANPLSNEKKYMRESLEGGLKDSLDLSVKNAPLLGLEGVMIFEIGKVFKKDSEDLQLGLAVSLKNKKEQKAYLENILKELNLDGEIKENVLLVSLNGKERDSYGDLNFNIDSKNKFKKISPYPFVLRDISLWCPQRVESHKVQKFIKENAGELLVNTTLFDEYNKEGRTSYAFKLVFQSDEKTLSDAEVGEIMVKIEAKIAKKEGWEVR